MQELLLVIVYRMCDIQKETSVTNKKEKHERMLSRLKWVVMLNVVITAGIVYYAFYPSWNLDISVLTYVCIPLVSIVVIFASFQNQIIIYLYSYVLKHILRKLTDVLAELKKQKNEHISTIHVFIQYHNYEQNVKGCLVDVNRLIVKYNIDTKQAVLPELKNALTEIETLLHVIFDLVELPLCEDCRYYTNDKVCK